MEKKDNKKKMRITVPKPVIRKKPSLSINEEKGEKKLDIKEN